MGRGPENSSPSSGATIVCGSGIGLSVTNRSFRNRGAWSDGGVFELGALEERAVGEDLCEDETGTEDSQDGGEGGHVSATGNEPGGGQARDPRRGCDRREWRRHGDRCRDRGDSRRGRQL